MQKLRKHSLNSRRRVKPTGYSMFHQTLTVPLHIITKGRRYKLFQGEKRIDYEPSHEPFGTVNYTRGEALRITKRLHKLGYAAQTRYTGKASGLFGSGLVIYYRKR